MRRLDGPPIRITTSLPSKAKVTQQMAKPARRTRSPISAADKAAALSLTPVSRETEARLDRYVDLLLEWQAKTNLVAPSTLPNLWTRHIADSLQLLALAPAAKVWIDLGSGGGFPGVVLACALAETPGTIVHLVERNAKKAAFLREALRVTSTPGMVLKGQDVEAELTEATKCWKITPQLHSSRTGGGGWIVELDQVERRDQSATGDGTGHERN